jgi:hypothetical protein
VAFIQLCKMHNYVQWESKVLLKHCLASVYGQQNDRRLLRCQYCFLCSSSVIIQYFALFFGEASRCFQKFRVLRRCGFVACVVSRKSAVSIFGVEEHRCVRNVYETNHAALLPKRQSFSQMVLRNSDLTCILRLTKKRQIEPVESIYENWQRAVIYLWFI